MRLVPLFDTNIFGDVQRKRISQTDWKYLLRCRPGRGWPLSSVTALELLAGLDAAQANFLHVRDRIALAYQISNGRILEDPRVLICKEILRIPFPPEQLPPSSSVISRYMDVIRRADSLKQLLHTGVPYKGHKARLGQVSVLADVMAGPKRDWLAAVQRLADEIYPDWRELFQQTGRRLPSEIREELELGNFWHGQRAVFINALLNWLGASSRPDLIPGLSEKLNAVLEFTIFVTREFLLHNYSLSKHQSDVFDQFQLQYLALDRFLIISSDPDLSVRTRQSPQAGRIKSFDQFLRTL